ncbi:MAG: hydrolase [Myxococcales bacterium]|nr:MAG: hydrolase [Myxococcales bacterium]
MTTQRIDTSQGPAEVVVHRAEEESGVVVLTHGAGGDVDSVDLTALAEALPTAGHTVMLVRMPWRVAGKKLAPRPAVIDQCYTEVLAGLDLTGPVVLGGRSAGARSACRLAAASGAGGVLALSFPLHPPGKPERSRLDELTGAEVPTLVVQGERDPFGRPEEYPADLAADLVVVPAADHSLKVPKRADITADEVAALVVEATLEWLVGLPGNDGG